ncbi:MAG: shikimate kinase [Porticoccaceae bacterium]|nr:shikimate kinase [Pseudomonadales bacterium]MCP5170856.1 shikimate kinase [Pseudomonadales bacterium]MCP5301904.1 shikimate kinase [Pseudomonadales bacterium]
MKDCIALIGMPGAGKSTVGVLLAKQLGMDFLDTDIAIQNREGKTLQQILDQSSYLHLRQIEEQVLLETAPNSTVIATGGSAVYSKDGMAHLAKFSRIVYLQSSLSTLQERINNHQTRGIAKRPEQSFEQLFEERTALYQQYADITVSCDKTGPEQLVENIIAALN